MPSDRGGSVAAPGRGTRSVVVLTGHYGPRDPSLAVPAAIAVIAVVACTHRHRHRHSVIERDIGPPSATQARGIFHKVDGAASGTVALEREVDGSIAVAFQELSTPSTAHIHVVVVAMRDVTRDQDVDPGTIVDLGPLKATTGMQDYWFPRRWATQALDRSHGCPLGRRRRPRRRGGARPRLIVARQVAMRSSPSGVSRPGRSVHHDEAIHLDGRMIREIRLADLDDVVTRLRPRAVGTTVRTAAFRVDRSKVPANFPSTYTCAIPVPGPVRPTQATARPVKVNVAVAPIECDAVACPPVRDALEIAVQVPVYVTRCKR